MLTYPLVPGSLPIGAVPPYVAPVATHERMLFLSSRDFDLATIVGSTEVSSLPASFLQDIQPQKKWRTTSKVDQWLQITLARPTACDTVPFIAPNFTGAAVVRILASNDLDTILTAPQFDSGWKSVWPASGKPFEDDLPPPTCLVRFTNTSAYKYWRILFADIGTETTYLEMGRVLIGQAFQLPVDLTPGQGLASPDAQGRTPFGRTYGDPRGDASRRFVLPISALNDTLMKRSLLALQRYCGLARDFVFSLDPGATTDLHLYTMQAQFTESAQFEAVLLWDAGVQMWRTTLTLTEPL